MIVPEFLDIALVINGERLTGWRTIDIGRSMEKGFFEFNATATSPWRTDSRRKIEAGQPFEVKYGNELLMTGYIDDVYPEYDANTHELSISGRSKTADLVDCSTIGKTFTDQTLVQIAEALCDPFDIKVIDKAGENKKFRDQQAIAEGEAIWDFLDQLARIRAVRLMSDVDGNLVITRAGTTRSKTPLVLGGNIRQASGTFSYRNRFRDYHVVANQAGETSQLTARDTSLPYGTIRDGVIKRHRPIVIVNEHSADIEDCQKRADWQMRTHAGRSESVVYTVGGWTDDNGKTWLPNVKVPVDDAYLGTASDKLIAESWLKLDKSGARTELLVMPVSAFDLVAIPEEKKGFLL